MEFTLFHKLQDKQNKWMDAAFYLACALLIATVFCYGIFTFKVYLENKKISDANAALLASGTDQQKSQAQQVIDYKKKINDFAAIIKNHKISSNVLAFIEERTLPSVWFSSFGVTETGNTISVSGESDSMDTLSRQVLVFETSKEYVKNISVLSSQSVSDKSIKFTLSIALDPKVFAYSSPLTNTTSTTVTTTPKNANQ